MYEVSSSHRCPSEANNVHHISYGNIQLTFDNHKIQIFFLFILYNISIFYHFNNTLLFVKHFAYDIFHYNKNTWFVIYMTLYQPPVFLHQPKKPPLHSTTNKEQPVFANVIILAFQSLYFMQTAASDLYTESCVLFSRAEQKHMTSAILRCSVNCRLSTVVKRLLCLAGASVYND